MEYALALLLISSQPIDCYPTKNMAEALYAGQFVPVQTGTYPLPNIILENSHGREIMLLFPGGGVACPVVVYKV